MWSLLANLVTLIVGASAAASLGESLAKAQSRQKTQRQLKRGLILPKEAARELEKQIGGRVVVGQDLEGPMLVILREKEGATPPKWFAGYRVKPPPEIEQLPGAPAAGVVIGNAFWRRDKPKPGLLGYRPYRRKR